MLSAGARPQVRRSGTIAYWSRNCLALPLVGEESKNPVLPDRPPNAAAELVIAVLIPEQSPLRRGQLSPVGIECLHRLGPFQR